MLPDPPSFTVRGGQCQSSTKDKLLCDFTSCYKKKLASTVSHHSNKQFVSPTLTVTVPEKS